ncbi:MAG: glycoside hydrolase domain-containing protein [Thermoanaerobaculia bacterium]
MENHTTLTILLAPILMLSMLSPPLTAQASVSPEPISVRRISEELGTTQELPSQRARVVSLEALSPGKGWILTDQRLLWSNDDGATWRDDLFVAPPGAHLSTAQFLSRDWGWVVVARSNGMQVLRTSNGGVTWTPTAPLQLPGEEEASGAALSFCDVHTGYLLVTFASGSNSSRGTLFRTTDGGSHWKPLPVPPSGGRIRFQSERNGWLAGGPAGGDLFVTRDGGQTWRTSRVTPPAEPLQTRLIYLLPDFDDESDGLLPVRLESPAGSAIALYGTQDGGLTWSLRGQTEPNLAVERPVDLRNNSVTTAESGGNLVTLSPEGVTNKAGRELPAGMTQDFDVRLLSFSEPQSGWIVVAAGHCAGFKSGCWQETRILSSRDGSASYEDVTPEFLKNANFQAEREARQYDRSRPAPSSHEKLLGSGTQIQQNRDGFDIACYPSVSTMQTWWTSSPYYYVSAYLGGTHAYCVNHSSTCPCPASSWLSQTAGQGWTFIPIWVGAQELYGDLSSNTTIAFNQGVSEANAAADRLATVGFPSGSIVYFDFERPHPASIEPSVKAFVYGWASQLHARGHNAGVYGSYLSAAAWQGSGVPISPDAIWPYNLNSGQTVFNLCGPSYCLPNDIWANHQRIHQYLQNVPDTQGGVSLTIDKDFADGPTAIYGGSLPTCTSFSISPSSTSPSASSGSQLVSVNGSPSGCQGGSWSASGNGSWISVSPSSGSGSGSVTVSWTQNSSTSSRVSSATLAGNSFSVSQAGASSPTCTSFSISPSSINPNASNGSQLVSVNGLPSGCQGGTWSTFSNDSWVSVSPSSSSGSGSATVSWTQNTSTSSRFSSDTIAGNSFSVNQAGSSQDTALSNGVASFDSVTGTGAETAWKYYYADLGPGNNNLLITLSGLSADADLYVRFNAKPTLSIYDCPSVHGGTQDDSCSIASPTAGRWWIGVVNYDIGTISYQIKASWSGVQGSRFYTVTPCRLLDTRSSFARLSGALYQLQVTGSCGIPSSATAIAANVTVVNGTGLGSVAIWPANLTQTNTSAINFAQGQIRANNATLMLSTDGLGNLRYSPSVAGNGSVDLIVDVSGYFAP